MGILGTEQDDSKRHTKWVVSGNMGLQPYTKSYGQLKMLRMGEIAFLKEEHTNSLSSTKGSALETHKEHYDD